MSWLQVYGFLVVLCYIVLGTVYETSKINVSRIRAQVALLDDIEAGQRNAIDFPPDLLQALRPRNELAVALPRERIRNRRLIDMLQVTALVLTVYAVISPFTIYYYDVKPFGADGFGVIFANALRHNAS